jgi:hypothetical protein
MNASFSCFFSFIFLKDDGSVFSLPSRLRQKSTEWTRAQFNPGQVAKLITSTSVFTIYFLTVENGLLFRGDNIQAAE